MARRRDYKAEYARRIERGLERGLSYARARGHPRAGDAAAGKGSGEKVQDAKLEAALKALREGKSLAAAARGARVSPERLRGFVYGEDLARREGKRWTVTDHRPRRVAIYSKGKRIELIAADYEQAALAGGYWDAAHRFVATNDIELLTPFIGRGVKDVKGRTRLFETDPNAIHRLASAGGPVFHEIYRLTR